MNEERRNEIENRLKAATVAADAYIEATEKNLTDCTWIASTFYSWHDGELRKTLTVCGDVREIAEAIGAEVKSETTLSGKYHSVWFEAYGYLFVQTKEVKVNE